ncbi:MAG: metallopeptidase TldD-related protein [Aestuariivita sp.]|nr:metallopeptidase TldD-related protein [Aestuariivita sp.]MCY4204072.1 metallopeptidase TldD-related protein [Aestuariivita sp.]MCY4286978.1 metallopeptidase TldD-related protein [Aestuariivita sp.]MCY4347994.1 metallopeptidase TldD-related protein [Aestuariivita sp.]
MSDTDFRPFETCLDQERAGTLVAEAANGADDGELFLERRQSETLVYEDSRLKNSSYSSAEGFGLRAVRGQICGYAHSNEISENALRRASETTQLAVKEGGGNLSEAPQPAGYRLYTGTDPITEISFSKKIDTLKAIDAFVRELDQRVVQVSVSLSTSLQQIEILRADGTSVSDRRPMSQVTISAVVEEDDRRESGRDGSGGRALIGPLLERQNWEVMAREAVRIATVNLAAEPAPAGVMDVVLGPGWPGILLHEAIGHGLEGDFNRKGTSAFAGLMGKRIAAHGVNVVDDGTIPDRRGSITIDDEGTPSACNPLIEDGILVGYLQDRQNARLMKTTATGNGRRQSYAHTPMPRMTNTYMRSGNADPDGLVAEVQDGIYAVGFGGGQVDITNGKFVFSCTEAYRIKNGKVGQQLRGATIIGDGATALKNIRGIGNDLKLDPGIGTCGKDGQWVPVGVGQPTLLIGGLTVGGAKI